MSAPRPVPGPARLPRIGYAVEAGRAYLLALEYRRWRPHVLAAVLAWMLARKIRGAS